MEEKGGPVNGIVPPVVIHAAVRRKIEEHGYIQQLIAKEAFAYVFDFVPKEGEQRQMVKIVKAMTSAERESFFTEVRFARAFGSPASVSLIRHGHMDQDHYFYGWLVFPKLPTLQDTLPEIHKEPRDTREKLAKRLMVQLLPHLKKMNGVGFYHNNVHPRTILVRKARHSFYFMLYNYSTGKEYDQVIETHWGPHKPDAIALIFVAARMVCIPHSKKWPEWLSVLHALVTTLPRGALVPFDRMKFMVNRTGEGEEASLSAPPEVHNTLKEAITKIRGLEEHVCLLFKTMWDFKIDKPFEPTETLLTQVESRSVRMLVPNKYLQMVVYVAEEDYEKVAWVSFVPLTRLSAKGASCLLEVILINPWGVLRECFELCK